MTLDGLKEVIFAFPLFPGDWRDYVAMYEKAFKGERVFRVFVR